MTHSPIVGGPRAQFGGRAVVTDKGRNRVSIKRGRTVTVIINLNFVSALIGVRNVIVPIKIRNGQRNKISGGGMIERRTGRK